VVDSFVLGGAQVAERRVQPAGVVPALDVLEDSASKSDPCGPRTRVDELAFDSGEKRFGHRVDKRLLHRVSGNPGTSLHRGTPEPDVQLSPLRLKQSRWRAAETLVDEAERRFARWSGDPLAGHLFGGRALPFTG
jgi:hypothetical protein